MKIPVYDSTSSNDLHAVERAIYKWSGVVAVLTVASVVLGYFYLPHLVDFPHDMTGALVLAIQLSIVPLLWLLLAVGIVSTKRRTSQADVRGSAFAPPSSRLAIPMAFLQNTLEQSVLLIGVLLILATVLSESQLVVLPILVLLFSIGRYLFYVGYTHDPASRVPGMIFTMLPTMLGYILALGLVVLHVLF